MACTPPIVSFARAPLGEEALNYMPDPHGEGEDLCLYCVHLEALDAPLAVALRATIEHFARTMPVSLNAPADPAVCAALARALGPGLPQRFELKEPTSEAGAPAPQILLPATCVPGFPEADQLSDRLPEELAVLGESRAAYLAAAASALLENALGHASANSIDPVLAISHDPDSGTARLAVADTGTEIESDIEAEQRLDEALGRSREREGGLVELAKTAGAVGLEARICLAAGSGRLRFDGSEWGTAEELYVAGTTAIVELPA